MKLSLSPAQVEVLLADYIDSDHFDEAAQKRLALRLFARNERIDPIVALRAAAKQISRDHCITVTVKVGP